MEICSLCCSIRTTAFGHYFGHGIRHVCFEGRRMFLAPSAHPRCVLRIFHFCLQLHFQPDVFCVTNRGRPLHLLPAASLNRRSPCDWSDLRLVATVTVLLLLAWFLGFAVWSLLLFFWFHVSLTFLFHRNTILVARLLTARVPRRHFANLHTTCHA